MNKANSLTECSKRSSRNVFELFGMFFGESFFYMEIFVLGYDNRILPHACLRMRSSFWCIHLVSFMFAQDWNFFKFFSRRFRFVGLIFISVCISDRMPNWNDIKLGPGMLGRCVSAVCALYWSFAILFGCNVSHSTRHKHVPFFFLCDLGFYSGPIGLGIRFPIDHQYPSIYAGNKLDDI